MNDTLPEFIVQGEPSRLFPVLATTSKEGRTTSIVLACLSRISEFGAAMLEGIAPPMGVRTTVDTFTEVVCKNSSTELRDRPDGLIVVKTGRREWRALVEAKIGSASLEAAQIEKYRTLAKDNDIDCVITISNQFASTSTAHPVGEVNRSRSKIPVYHWSWMNVLTDADLLLSQKAVEDNDQRLLLNELRRFLTHESAGVRGFDRMPKEWISLNKLVASGGKILAKSEDAAACIGAWHQEMRDLTLILSRMTETAVNQRLSRKHRLDINLRVKDELVQLREELQLSAELEIPDAAAPLSILADLRRRCIDVGMLLRAPEDKVSTKARLNWLLRQIKTQDLENLHVRLMWPGKAEPTQYLIADLQGDSGLGNTDREHLSPYSFYIFKSWAMGARFAQQSNFIADIETFVPEFYRDVGSHLSAWQKRAPLVKQDRASAKDVTTEAISEDARQFET